MPLRFIFSRHKDIQHKISEQDPIQEVNESEGSMSPEPKKSLAKKFEEAQDSQDPSQIIQCENIETAHFQGIHVLSLKLGLYYCVKISFFFY